MQTSNSNGQSTAIVRPGDAAYQQAGTAIERQGFGSSEMEVRRETQGGAAAEHAKALVQARYIMAERKPRDFQHVRARLLRHCERPGFAAVAEYAKPIGGSSVKGPSIRFVETALQEYGNVTIDVAVVYDDDEKRVVRVALADLERNLPYTEDVTVEKFVERRSTKAGDEVVGERKNRQGVTVYRVRATEDDYANKLAAAVSKKIRQLGLRILPADLVDEAMDECAETRRNKDAQDPNAAINKIADAFTSLNILPAALKEYLGHEIATSSPVEIDLLRKVYTGIKDGETTWIAVLDAKRAERGEVTGPTDKTGDKLKEKLATAPLKDKVADTKPTSKPRGVTAMEARRKALAAAVTWSRNGDRHLGPVEDLELIVEQVGPEQWGWWVTRNGEDLATGEAADLELAKGMAIDAASKL